MLTILLNITLHPIIFGEIPVLDKTNFSHIWLTSGCHLWCHHLTLWSAELTILKLQVSLCTITKNITVITIHNFKLNLNTQFTNQTFVNTQIIYNIQGNFQSSPGHSVISSCLPKTTHLHHFPQSLSWLLETVLIPSLLKAKKIIFTLEQSKQAFPDCLMSYLLGTSMLDFMHAKFSKRVILSLQTFRKWSPTL